MPEGLGISLYLSTFDSQRPALESLQGGSPAVFLSLHMSEEFGEGYCRRAEEVCAWLRERGFRVLADVSVKTLRQFQEPDLLTLARRLGLWGLRLDYGVDEAETLRLAARLPVALNASTVPLDFARRAARAGAQTLAVHNFYPRPETGLDRPFFLERTRALQAMGLKVWAFIPGDAQRRGPLGLGLPTLEEHRDAPPSAAYADLLLRCGADGVFLADPGLSPGELGRIRRYETQGVWALPAVLAPEQEGLYGRVFTCRPDSPRDVLRFAESREYSCAGASVPPGEPVPRVRGSVTLDNDRYARYSGELQLLRADFPADPRINVVGRLAPGYELLADCIPRGGRFALVPPDRTA